MCRRILRLWVTGGSHRGTQKRWIRVDGGKGGGEQIWRSCDQTCYLQAPRSSSYQCVGCLNVPLMKTLLCWRPRTTTSRFFVSNEQYRSDVLAMVLSYLKEQFKPTQTITHEFIMASNIHVTRPLRPSQPSIILVVIISTAFDLIVHLMDVRFLFMFARITALKDDSDYLNDIMRFPWLWRTC